MRKKVIYTSSHIPPEWIEAHGLEAIHIVPEFTNSQPIEEAEGLCAFMRAFYNSLAKHNPIGVITTSVCDQMRRGYDLYRELSTTPIFLFNQPALWQRTSHIKLYVEELRKMSTFLQSIGGTVPNNCTLRDTMLRWESRRAGEILSLQNDQYSLQNVGNQPQFKVGLIGGPLISNLWQLTDQLVQRGGEAVFDLTEFSVEKAPTSYDRRELRANSFMHMAEKWFESNHSIYQRPNTRFYTKLKEKMESTKPDALILIRWIWCDFWHAETNRIEEFTKLPQLSIDVNDNDAYARNKTRIEAFIESLVTVGAPF